MLAPIVSLAAWEARPPATVTVDVRWYLDGRSGRDAYAAGHLPGAVWVDLDAALSGPGGPGAGRHPLPTPQAFAAALGALGIGDTTPVLAYDDQGGVVAARLVWMLRAIGHDAALVDGGLLAYDGPLETGSPTLAPATFTPRPWPAERLANADDALDRGQVVLDARPPERYRGDGEPLDPRAGHVPGARSVPVRGHVDETGRLRGDAELRATFAEAGVGDEADVVAYCGSGVTACHNLLVLEHLGLGARRRLYPGSWSHYSQTDRPAALGPSPG